MDYPFTLPGHPDLNLNLRAGGFFAGPQIWQDGVLLKKSKNAVQVPLADGSTLELTIKVGMEANTAADRVNG